MLKSTYARRVEGFWKMIGDFLAQLKLTPKETLSKRHFIVETESLTKVLCQVVYKDGETLYHAVDPFIESTDALELIKQVVNNKQWRLRLYEDISELQGPDYRGGCAL